MKDEQIVALYWDRNEDAIQQTQQKYGAYLSKIAYNILSDFEDSKECVNDTYLKAWNSMPTHRPSVLSTYLGKIARQISIDVFRKKNSAKRYASEYAISLAELGDSLSDGTTPEQVLDAKLQDEAINRFLRALPDDSRNTYRKILFLRFAEGCGGILRYERGESKEYVVPYPPELESVSHQGGV